ncbi:MAG: histidine phosphatase family protein [Candidatus Moraniibacteriota bacterium]|nr:MAG: histidine phosphatase family protein [Candidatus Moranbacteria bacterium]
MVVTDHYLRHAEKGKGRMGGDLSAAGEGAAAAVGHTLSEQDVIKAYTGTVPRTKDTAQLIVGASPTERKLVPRIRQSLDGFAGFFVDPQKSPLWQKLLDDLAHIPRDLPPDEQKKEIARIGEEFTTQWIAFEDKRPDEGTLSPLEVALNMAKSTVTHSKMAERLKSGTKNELINVTHEGMLTAMLRYFLRRKNEDGTYTEGKELLEKLGPVQYLDDIIIRTATDAQGKRTSTATFRGEEYVVTGEELLAHHKDSQTSS